MRTVRVYSQTTLQPGQRVTLDADVARHVGTVLRMHAGDTLLVFDDSGNEYSATIAAVSKRNLSVDVGSATGATTESPLAIVLLQGVCRGERMDYVVQKATELGVAELRPVFTERGGVKLDDQRRKRRTAHWRSVAVSAAEQSGRTRIPPVHMPQPLVEALGSGQLQGTKLALDPDGTNTLAAAIDPPLQTLTLLVGPEGGFSDSEREAMATAGFTRVTLGPRVLRTETAPVAALSIVQALAGDLG